MSIVKVLPDIISLKYVLEKCWTKGKPRGQCYITALIVQDLFGGEIVRTRHDKLEVSHYWNVLPDGTEIDLTSDQFETGDGFNPIWKGKGTVFTRAQKLYPYLDTIERYTRLMMKVAEILEL